MKAAAKAHVIPILIPDIKRPSKEVEKLLYRAAGTLYEVINLIGETLKN